MSDRYVATLRAVFDAEDDVSAQLIAETIAHHGRTDLEEDEGDSLDVTQVTNFGINLTPEETITRLKQARNLLIKTKLRYCWDQAKELDKVIWALEHRDDDMFLAGYDWGRFLQMAKAIIDEGANPLDV